MQSQRPPCPGTEQQGSARLAQAVYSPDYGAVFAAQPTAYLVMTPDLVIADCNEAYLQLLGRTREELVGRPVFDAFPPAPGTLDEQGRNPLQLSFERARDSGLPDQLPLFNYDVLDPETGEMRQRFWSLISSAVPGPDGRAVLVLQRVEDVTDYVADRQARQAERARGQEWERRVEQVEADLFARAQELRAARDAEAQANRRLAALADVALQLAQAQTVKELTEVIVQRGLVALGADGGALAVRDDTDALQVTVSAGLGPAAQQTYGQTPLDSPLPGAVTARTGQRLLLSDEAASLAFHPSMRQVVDATGCPAWACVPLQLKTELLGSLSVGWSAPRTFTASELELLEVLASQTAHGLSRIQFRQAESAAALAAQRMSETLQRSLLTDPPQPGGLQIAVRYRPAAQQAQVGGDWYDAFLTSNGTVCVAIGDVAGHDRDAAATMGQLRNLMRGIAYTVIEPPARVLTALDRALHDLDVGALATSVLATVHPLVEEGSRSGPAGSWLLRWSNAGHPPPVLVQPDGTARLLASDPDLLLGLDPTSSRADHEALLRPGSVVLLYTDGLVERRGAALDHGLDWLVEAATGLAQAAPSVGRPGREEDGGPDRPAVLLDRICDGLLEQVGGGGQDDIALLALRVLPSVRTAATTTADEQDQDRAEEQPSGRH